MYFFREGDILFHEGTRPVRQIIMDCWHKTFGNVTFQDDVQITRNKRHFEDLLETEATKLPEKSRPSFYAIAFNIATEKILSKFQVTVLSLQYLIM